MADVTVTDLGGVILADARALGGFPVKKGARYAYPEPRDLDSVDAVGAHHWGPPAPSLVPRGTETMVDAAVRRSRSVAYHVSLWAPEGLPSIVVLAWPLTMVTWHGNGLNRRSVGLAFAGNFPALEAERAPGHSDPLDFAAALRVALEALLPELPMLRFLLTHSQAANKPADPGELAARLLAAEGGRLGLSPLPDWTAPRPTKKSPRGAPWPAEWRRPLSSPSPPNCPACGRPLGDA